EAKPAKPVENALDHFGRRTLDVGVLDAQHEGAAVAPCEEPVEQRGARAADVQIAGWGGSESNAGGGHVTGKTVSVVRRRAVRFGGRPSRGLPTEARVSR